MIPSSITVSVTLVLMAGPVRIGWMDITVIVHLVSNSRKLFRVLESPGKLKSKMTISCNLPKEKKVGPLLRHDFLNKCGRCHFILCLHFSCFVLLLSAVSLQFGFQVCNFSKMLDYDLTAVIIALLLLNTEHIILLDKDSVLSVDIFITAA